MFIGVSLAAAGFLAFSLRPQSQGPEGFALGVEWTGRTADNYSAFMVSLTNRGPVAVTLKGIQFQWIDRAGRIDSCHATSSPQRMQSNSVVTAYIAVPPGAKKLRVLVCGAPGPARKQVTGILTKLPSGLRRLVSDKWLYNDDIHSSFPWIANPATAGNRGSSSHLPAGRSLAAVPEQKL